MPGPKGQDGYGDESTVHNKNNNINDCISLVLYDKKPGASLVCMTMKADKKGTCRRTLIFENLTFSML